MFKKPLQTQHFLFSLLMSFASIGFANDIRVPDAKAYNEHKEILKGLVAISSREACTAARVGPKVLLTAKHCAKFKPNVNNKITLKVNNSEYSVEKFLVPTTKENEEMSATDIALILLDRNLPDDIPTLKIADRSTRFSSSEYLAAGYGLIDEAKESEYENIDGRHFSAAIGQWAHFVSPTTSVELRKTDDVIFDHLKVRYPETHAAVIKFNCKTTEYYQNVFSLAGQNPMDRKYDCSAVKNFKTAQLTPGDSGGPAIMFDENRNPVIVGVASRGSFEKNYVHYSDYKVSAYGLDRLPQKTDTKAPEKTFIETHSFCFEYNSNYTLTENTKKIWDKINRELILLARETFDLKLFKVIALETETQNYGVSVYASVLSDRNFSFIQNGLKELSQK